MRIIVGMKMLFLVLRSAVVTATSLVRLLTLPSSIPAGPLKKPTIPELLLAISSWTTSHLPPSHRKSTHLMSRFNIWITSQAIPYRSMVSWVSHSYRLRTKVSSHPSTPSHNRLVYFIIPCFKLERLADSTNTEEISFGALDPVKFSATNGYGPW